MDIVHIGRIEKIRAIVQPLIKFRTAACKVPCGKTGIDFLPATRQFPGLIEHQEGIADGSRMAAQIFLIGFCEHLGNGKGNRSHTKGQGGAIWDFIDDIFSNLDVRFRRCTVLVGSKRCVFPFDDEISVVKAHAVRTIHTLKSRHVFIDFKYDGPGFFMMVFQA